MRKRGRIGGKPLQEIDMQEGNKRMVKCSKLGRELPGLENPPFKGEAGRQVYENVSQEAWTEWWDEMQIKVLNEYRLNMAKPEDYQILFDKMMEFLNLPRVAVI